MSETMMTVAEWYRLRDEDRMCWECGFHSPLVPVCGECEAHGKGIDAGRAAAEQEISALTTERDEARSRLAKAREEIEAFATPVDLMRQRIERDTASAIAAWLDERYDVHEMGSNASAIVCRSAAADIRANAWRSK